jgi:hypothetical protein
VSSRFLAESTSTRLSTVLLLLAALLLAAEPSTASAQDVPTDGVPFSSVVDGSAYLGNGFRIWHHTRGYGEETSETALGGRLATPTAGGLAFMDGQFRVGNSDTDFSVNLGGGFRWRNDDYFFDSPRIFGFSFWYDGEDTQLDNYFNQLGVSFERLGPLVDLRLNANIPLEDLKEGDDVMFTGDTVFSGNNLSRGTLVDADASLRVVDFEVAPRLFNLNAWGYGGGYQMDGNDVSEMGYKVGVRGYIYNDLALDVGVTDDDHFGTNTVVQVIWTPGRVSPGVTNWSHNIDDRMREQVYRNQYVAVTRTQVAGAVSLTDVFGDEIRVVHVDSNAAAGGNGTFENPLNNLNDIDDNSEVGDIVLAHSTSVFNGQSATLQDAQRFLGEGLNNDGTPQVHTVLTSELGQINLPESSPGASMLARPIIQNSAAPAAVVLMGGNDEVNTLAEIEVSNFTIDGGTRGVYSPTGVGDVNINQLRVENITGDGIELTPLVETLANNSTQIRFTPTINEVIFDNVGGDDIDLNGTTGEPSATAVNEAIAISNIESDDGDGVGIRLTNHRRAATISNFDWDGGTTGLGALRIENNLVAAFNPNQATVTMSGTNAMTGGVTGVGGDGYAIRLEGGAATHTIGGTTITNMGGDAIIASGGTAGMNFTGRIEQTSNNASILSVENGHDGNLTFTELTANAGVIRATTGDGLQFNDADGVYTFVDNVDIEGVAAGGATSAVNVQGDSEGVITLTDATFDNINGDTITFVGGTANLTLTGRINQTLNAFSVLDVSGGHDGTLVFNEITAGAGVINATTGDGLQFNDADGAYTFNSGVTLAGTSEGISVSNGSSGTFAFTDADNEITNPTGNAIEIAGSDAIFSYAGEIDTNAGRPFLYENNTGGSATISAAVDAIAGSQGILIRNNTGGDVLFSGQVTLTTTTQDAVTITNNTDGSTRFNNLDITTTTGIGFNANNNPTPYEINVAGAGNTIATTSGTGLVLDNVNVGTANVNFASVSVSAGTAEGIILRDVTGGAVIIGAQGTSAGDGGTISSTATALLIENVASSSINHMSLTTTGATPTVNFDVDATATSSLTLNNNNVTNSGAGNGIDLNIAATGGASTVALIDNDVTVASGTGVVATNDASNPNADLTLNGSGNTVVANTGAGVNLSNVNIVAGGLTFTDVDITAGTNAITLNDITGGPVAVTGGTAVTSGAAVVITDAASTTISNMTLNSGGAAAVDFNVTTAAASALTLTNNDITTGAANGVDINLAAAATSGTVTLTNNDIVTAGGTGVITTNAAAVGALQLNGSGNTVSTATGVALNLVNANISGAGLSFNSVSSTAAATSGIIATNLTGAVLSVGAQGTNPGDGGTINAVGGGSGSAVVITNSANVSLNNMILTSANGSGVDYNVTTSAASRLTLNGNLISDTNLEGVNIDVSGAATLANISILDNVISNTSADEAIVLTTSGGTAKTVNLLVDANDISNDTAAAPAANFVASGNVTLNATVTDNIFNSAATGQPFRMESGTAQSRVRLNLMDNTASEGTAADDFFLVETAGNFSVQNLAGVAAGTENTGGVNFSPNQAAFTNDAGGIPTP